VFAAALEQLPRLHAARERKRETEREFTEHFAQHFAQHFAEQFAELFAQFTELFTVTETARACLASTASYRRGRSVIYP
jgi:hypothetical protein